MLVHDLMPAALTGLVLGALTVGALVPASVMSIAAATLFVRNIYVEYFHPTATPKHQMRIAQTVSVCAKLGAIVFVFGLRNQAAINLQLLGGVWILQTFPAVAIGLYSRWLHPRALLAGWAFGMLTGTTMVVWDGFSPVVSIDLAGHHVQVYAALVALALNLTVTVTLTPVLDRLTTPRRAHRTMLPAAPVSPPAPWTSPT
jgi:SSS family solute:Na+ symporter